MVRIGCGSGGDGDCGIKDDHIDGNGLVMCVCTSIRDGGNDGQWHRMV